MQLIVKRSKKMSQTSRKQSGFSMFEVLVTLVITSVGLLGLGAMQLISMKNVNSANYRSLATMYAYDMAERMRSNKGALATYNGIDGMPSTIRDCSAGKTCSAAHMAEADAAEWMKLIQGDGGNAISDYGLPNGNGKVTADGDYYLIEITWDEQDQGTGSAGQITNQSFVLAVRI